MPWSRSIRSPRPTLPELRSGSLDSSRLRLVDARSKLRVTQPRRPPRHRRRQPVQGAFLVRPISANTLPHRRQGSQRDGGFGSCRLARRQSQARQEKRGVLWVSVRNDVRYHDRGDHAQSADDLSRFVEPSHMRITCGEKAVGQRPGKLFERP